jgi:hypothetical protein
MPPLIITDENETEQIRLADERRAIARSDRQLPFDAIQLTETARCRPFTTTKGASKYLKPTTDLFPTIQREDWRAIITTAGRTTLTELRKDVLPPHDQGPTNYCWAHGVNRAVEVQRLYQGLTPTLLAAESIAVPITGGRNRGGGAGEAIDQYAKVGACRQTLWPQNDRNILHAKDGWAEDRKNHRVLQWLKVNTWEEQITLALHRIPVAIGLDWWNHLVCQLDAVILPNGQIGIGIDNSWGPDWGQNGYGILDEKHGRATLGAVAPYQVTWPYESHD